MIFEEYSKTSAEIGEFEQKSNSKVMKIHFVVVFIQLALICTKKKTSSEGRKQQMLNEEAVPREFRTGGYE